MEEVTAPVITTPESIRTGAADLLKKLVDKMLNYKTVADEEWMALGIEADIMADVLAVEPADCLRCRGREFKEPEHQDGCPLLVKQDQTRDEMVAALEVKLEALDEEYRDIVRTAKVKDIDALFACTCEKPEPAKRQRGGADNSFSGRVRKAEQKMTAAIVEVAGKPDLLRIEFANGDTQKWDLPSKGDHPAIKTITSTAIAWAADHNASDGQKAAVRKALNDKAYFARAK